MMGKYIFSKGGLGAALAWLWVVAVGAALPADPTEPAAGLSATLTARLAQAPEFHLHALVVGATDTGVALLGLGADSATCVRPGTYVEGTVEGLRVRARVAAVGTKGVELEAERDGARVWVAGSYTALPAPTASQPEFLRYVESEKVPIGPLMRLLADQTGVNISVSDAAAEKTVSIFLRHVTIEAAVEEICRTTGLWYRREPVSRVIRVTTMREFTENLNSFREETTETFTLLYPNVIEVASVIYGLYPDRTLLSLGEEEFLQEDEYELSRRFRRFRVIEDNGGSPFLDMEPSQSTAAGMSTSSGTFSYSRGGALSRLQQWDQMYRRLRQRAEETKLSANEAQSVGANAEGTNAWTRANIFVTLSRRNNSIIVRTSDVRVMDEVRRLVKRLDVPTPMVLMEVKVMELDVTDNYNANFAYTFNTGSDASGAPVALRDVAGQFLPGNLSPISAATMGFQVINDHVAMQIRLLEQDGKVRTLATPTLLVANNEVSRIFSGKEYPIVRGVTAGETISSSQSGIVTRNNTVQIEWKDIGTMLLITPNINSDKTVTLRLLQENSEIDAQQAEIPLDGGDLSQRTKVDVVDSRSVTGTFVARDGLAVMAGGLIKETEKEIYTRTPFLGSLPLVGWLFRGTEKVKERKELIVTIRPHVISTPFEGGRVSEELLKALSAHPARDGRASLGVHQAQETATPLQKDVERVMK